MLAAARAPSVDFMIGFGDLDVDGVLSNERHGASHAQRRMGYIVASRSSHKLPRQGTARICLARRLLYNKPEVC